MNSIKNDLSTILLRCCYDAHSIVDRRCTVAESSVVRIYHRTEFGLRSTKSFYAVEYL
ncbi:hypothetical protein ACPUEN_04435 [Algoriphagus yeomjeoni]|uniref:hypothetical protein n=1 Tax=Algoriphagus yeomjeoni TaxID=291403 RepID=UPI003CE45E9D